MLNENGLYEDIIELSTKYLNNKAPNPNLLYARAMAYEELREIKLMEKRLNNCITHRSEECEYFKCSWLQLNCSYSKI